MLVKGIKDEDFVNYKIPSMFIAFPSCTFKCDRENHGQYCQNMPLTKAPNIFIDFIKLVERYRDNPITHAIVCGGLEPFDSWSELWVFIWHVRKTYSLLDDIVIYTGYTEEEVADKVDVLTQFPNIIIKFGRFRPDQKPHLDPVLGIQLASDNQYAKRIS